MPDMTPVSSSLIKEVGYDPEKEELYVQFFKGSCYIYKDVPLAVFEAMLNAKSIGRFFLRVVKPEYACSGKTEA